MAPSPQEHWDTAWHQFHSSPDWRQAWKGLKTLVALDISHFPERLLPTACGLLGANPTRNLLWLKSLAVYGQDGPRSPASADRLWKAWEAAADSDRFRNHSDGRGLAISLRALSTLERRWFPGRLRPRLLHLLTEMRQQVFPAATDFHVVAALGQAFRHDPGGAEAANLWHAAWESVLADREAPDRLRREALLQMIWLDTQYLPGAAVPHLTAWLRETSAADPDLHYVARRYTLRARAVHRDELALAWKDLWERTHSFPARHVLFRLKRQLSPEVAALVEPVLATKLNPVTSHRGGKDHTPLTSIRDLRDRESGELPDPTRRYRAATRPPFNPRGLLQDP